MKKLYITSKTIKINTFENQILFEILNPECNFIATHSVILNEGISLTLPEINAIKTSMLGCVNNYLGGQIYELDSEVVPRDFYDKCQKDGVEAVNNLMVELLNNSIAYQEKLIDRLSKFLNQLQIIYYGVGGDLQKKNVF